MATDRQRTARRFRELDAAVPVRTRELTADLRAAHLRAGCPSFIDLDERNVEAGRGRLTKATLSRIFTPDPHGPDQSLPAWPYYEDLLRVLGEEPATYRERQQAAQREWQNRDREQGDRNLQPINVSDSRVNLPDDLDLAGAKRRHWGIWTRRRRVVIGGAIAVVLIAVAAFLGIPTLFSHSRVESKAQVSAKTSEPTAPLVTGAPPPTIEGTVVRTYNKAAGKSIGVRVYPTPYNHDGAQNGPTRDGAVVNVVCHFAGGRNVHENLEPPGRSKDSTGWYRIFYGNRLWYVSDHYVEFAPGQQPPPNC